MRAALALLLGLSACGLPPSGRRPSDPQWRGYDALRSVETSVGRQLLADDAYGPLDELTVLGIEVVEDYGLAPFYLEGGLHYGYDRTFRDVEGERVKSELSRFEFTAGLRFEPLYERLSLSPYVGLGAALVLVNADLNDMDDDQADSNDSDSALGLYWKVGVALPINYATHVGIEVRGVQGGAVSTAAFDAELDATMVALVFGFRR